MKLTSIVMLSLLSTTALAAQLKCSVQTINEVPYEVLSETEEVVVRDMPLNSRALRMMQFEDGTTLSIWSIKSVSLGEGLMGERFTYSFEADNGSWTTSTVTIDPRFANEPGAMRFSPGGGSYFNLLCAMK